MLTLIIAPQVVACQIDDFPKEKCERSVEGSLHLRPGTMEVTADEWKHLQDKHPAVAKFCKAREPAKAAPAPAPVPVADEALPTEEPAAEEPKHSFGKKHK